MEEGKMNEKQKEQLKVAARYGVCDGKYLGELIDQIRMAGVNKNDLRQMCHIIVCNAKDSVESLFRDFINDDQYQRLFACIQAESKTDVFMEALEYAYRVYGSKSGRLPVLDAGKQRISLEHITAMTADGHLSCQDIIELTEIFPDFAAVFQKSLEAFVESMDAWSPEDLEKVQRILGLLTKEILRTKNRKILDMRLLQEKNVTNQSDGARRLRKYFSLRQIRYLNVKLADRARLSDTILQKIDASFIHNLICSGDDETAPYTEVEKELLLQTCDRELKPKINGYSEMRAYVQTIRTDQYEQPKLTEENWMFLYQKMVCETYEKGFMSFLKILKFDCLAHENRNRWMAVTKDDRRKLLQSAIYDVSSEADEKSGRKEEVLKATLSLIVWTMQQNGVEVNEETKLKTCIQYAGPYTPAFIQAGLVRYETEAFEDFWSCAQSLSRLDTMRKNPCIRMPVSLRMDIRLRISVVKNRLSSGWKKIMAFPQRITRNTIMEKWPSTCRKNTIIISTTDCLILPEMKLTFSMPRKQWVLISRIHHAWIGVGGMRRAGPSLTMLKASNQNLTFTMI